MRLIDAHSLYREISDIEGNHTIDGIEYVQFDKVVKAINNSPTISVTRSEDSDGVD